MVSSLVAAIQDDLKGCLRRSPCASIAVSGGGTPVPLYDQLAKTVIDWANVVVTLTDERWVNSDSLESNERMVKQHLLQYQAEHARFIPIKNDADTPECGAIALDRVLQQELPVLDLVILGMGNDGHFASLFPGAAALEEGLSLGNKARCIAVRPPSTEIARISLTLSMLLTAKKIYLLIVGKDKLATLENAIGQVHASAEDELPIVSVLRQAEVPVHIYWSEKPCV